MEKLEQYLGLKPHHSKHIGFWKVLLSERNLIPDRGRTAELCSVLERRLYSEEEQQVRLMEGSTVLLYKGSTPWQGLLLTGKGTHFLNVGGLIHKGKCTHVISLFGTSAHK